MPRLSFATQKARKENLKTILASLTTYGPGGMTIDDILGKLPASEDKTKWRTQLTEILDDNMPEATVVKPIAKLLAAAIGKKSEDLLIDAPAQAATGSGSSSGGGGGSGGSAGPTTKLGQAYALLLAKDTKLTHAKVAKILKENDGEVAALEAALAGLLIDEEPEAALKLEDRLVKRYNIWGVDADDVKPKGKSDKEQGTGGGSRPTAWVAGAKPDAAPTTRKPRKKKSKKKSATAKKPAAKPQPPKPAPVAAEATVLTLAPVVSSPVRMTKAMALRLVGKPVERNGTGFVVHLPEGERTAIETQLRKAVKNPGNVIFDALWASAAGAKS